MPVATQRGGAEMTLLHALRHGAPGDRWLVIFLEDGPMVETVRALGIEAVVIPSGRIRDVRRAVAATRTLRRRLREWRPEVVISWMPNAHLYTSVAAFGLGLPLLWFQHGLPSSSDPLDRVIALLPAKGVLAPSEVVAASQRSIWPARATFVAYPGVDAAALPAPSATRVLAAEIGVPATAPLVGLVARLQRWKGVHVLVDALPRVLASAPDVHMVVVGGDHPLEADYRAVLEGRIAELGVQDRIHLVGYQPDALAWMAEFDIVVHASDNEPFGLVVIEAMALGKPLIAGAAGGPAEILHDGVDAFLVPFGDSSGLADRIVGLLRDPERAQALARSASTAAERFSAVAFAERVDSVLSQQAARA